MNSIIKAITSLSNQYNHDLKSKEIKKTLLGFLILFSLFFRAQIIIAQPTITSFTPLRDTVGATVSITGTGFNTTATNNVVFFGATRATVTAATATSLIVTVPAGATFAPIAVLNSATGLAAYSTQFFNPTFKPNKGSITSADISTKIDSTTGPGPRSVKIGDMDQDGKPDLIVVNAGSGFGNNTVSILRNISNLSTINFETKVNFPTDAGPKSTTIGDIDGDGKLDIITSNEFVGTISILRNTSSSGILSFATKIDLMISSNPMHVALGDINKDGKLDIAVANGNNNSVSVLRNSSSIGIISFDTIINFFTGNGAGSVAIADINGDNKLDLLISNYSNGSISVLRNISNSISNISFASKIDYLTGGLPQILAVGDLDMDGKLDLITPNWAGGTISILRNTSSNDTIRFATKIDLPTGSGTWSVAIGDVDGDNKLDLAVTNRLNDSVSILRNVSNVDSINFMTKVNFETGYNPWSVAIGDFNLDGKPDLAIANSNSNSVSVLRNNPQFPLINTINTITPFFSCLGKASMQKNFIINGINLTANLSITAPLGFEISLTPNTGFGANVNLTPVLGTIINTTIYLRLNSNVTGSFNGNIICSSIGATTKNIAVSGLVNVVTITTSTNIISICPSSLPYTWNGKSYNTNIIDTIYLANSLGCDSITILKLIVKPTSTSTTNISICPSALPYIWNGLIFNAAGTQTKTGLTNSLGCDSSATLNLTVNPIPATSNITGLTNVARLDTASYSVTGTSGSVFNWVTTKGLVQTGAGTNQIQVKWNAIGIDTLKVTETSNQGCVGAQKILLVTIGPATGMHEINTYNNILVYPNPFNETIYISLLNNSGLNKAILYDLLGKEILTTHKSEIDVKDLKSGVYLIMVIDNNGNSYSQKLMKN